MALPFIAICLTAGTSFAMLTMTRPFVPLFASELGAGPFAVGVVAAAFAVLPLPLAVPAGALTDRVGPRAMCLAGSLAMALVTMGVGLFPSMAALIAGQALLGVAQLTVVVSLQTAVASAKGDAAREHWFGLYTASVSLGQLIGPLIGGYVADRTAFTTTFIVAGLAGLVTPALAWGMPKQGMETTGGTSGGRSIRAIRRLLRHKGIQAGIVTSFGAIFTLGLRQAFFPLYLQGLGYPATVIGSLLSAQALASVLVRPAMPRIIAWSGGRFPVLVGSLALLAIAMLITPFSTTPVPLALASILIGIGLGLCQPISMVTVADSVEPEIRGLAMGVRMTGNRLAQLTNPLFFGAVTAAIGLGPAFILSGALLCFTTGLILRMREAFPAHGSPRSAPL